MPETAERQPLLSVRGLRKSFGPVRAVDDVSLDIYPEEVVGIVGDNAAGKSTFLSLLTGYHRVDAGEIFYQGRKVEITSPLVSRRKLGVEMIYQNLSLAPDMEVWQNLFLGEEMRRLGVFLDVRRMKERAREVLARLSAAARPEDLVGSLSGGEQQVVAIARALLFDRRVIIMDEPTAAISIHKVQDVLALVQELRRQGKTVLLVSHRLEDILSVSDRIVVFSHGKIRTVVENRNLTVDDLIHIMFGGNEGGGGYIQRN